MGKLDNKVMIVTGGASGMGNATVKLAAEYGAIVNVFDFSDAVENVAVELREAGYEANAYKVDVSSAESVNAAVASVFEKYGRIDCLINVAGICLMENFISDIANEKRDKMFAVNYFGVWNTCQAVLPHMLGVKYGKIVNFSSVTGPVVANNGMAAYASTKAAVMALTKQLALETAPFNITVNAIMPGMVATPMFHKGAVAVCPEDPMSEYERIAQGVPMKRIGDPREAAEAVCFLASDESSYITGVAIAVDGGSLLPEVNETPDSILK